MLSFAIIMLGLMVGSFLNVVIYRLPKAVIKQYKYPSQHHALDPLRVIASPRSFAPCCKKQLTWFENIPLLSWLILKGRCRYCLKSISFRYSLVESLTACFFYLCYQKFGFTISFFFWTIFLCYLTALFFIDLDTFLLPDLLTISLAILGFIASFFQWITTSMESAVIGLALGYGLPWIVNKIYYAWRKQDGFGAGDFKLLAALGIWLGWESIIPILFASALLALLIVLFLNLFGKKINLKTQLPFGPFLITVSMLIFFLNSLHLK